MVCSPFTGSHESPVVPIHVQIVANKAQFSDTWWMRTRWRERGYRCGERLISHFPLHLLRLQVVLQRDLATVVSARSG